MIGQLVSEVDTNEAINGQMNLKLLEKLLSAFWEFQTIGKKVTLEQKFTIEKVKNHLRKTKNLLNNYSEIESMVNKYQDFWNTGYPSKWKFAPDNLILTRDSKIGLIDNSNVGLRYFGYDLGWLIWPRWVLMKTECYDKIEEQLEYLDNFSKKLLKTVPINHTAIEIEQYFWLMIMERLIGMFFDVANNTKHIKRWAIGPEGDAKRTKKYLYFLESLLKHTLTKIS
ncbi:MAG: hypothetical protein ABIF80_02620 [Patescibacteria group bacterium]